MLANVVALWNAAWSTSQPNNHGGCARTPNRSNPSFLKGELLWRYGFLLEMSCRRNA